MPPTLATAGQKPGTTTRSARAGELLAEAQMQQRSGRINEALEIYHAAMAAAEQSGDGLILAEALRRLSVVHHHRDETERAGLLCRRSYETALALGDECLAAEALNTLGGFALEHGAMHDAERLFGQALELGASSLPLRSRVEQNLGILANMRGDHTEALRRYHESLQTMEAMGDDGGCAVAYHNLGMISADRREWDEAEGYYLKSRAIAERIGDVHLQGLCLLNHSEIHIARGAFHLARCEAEAALVIFVELGSSMDKSDAYRVLGVVFRETGLHELAESRIKSAIALAVNSGSLLSEAEASRELARVYQGMGRNQEALTLLNASYRLFQRLDAELDLKDVEVKVGELEGTYLALVRAWGQSIESADLYTFGHCVRVADYAEAVARALGMEDNELTTVRLGAYLHDVGKVKVPHEILNKRGELTADEFEVIKQHPLWGLELLATIEFPWDIKPIIRWHHEKFDGTGYPDRLCGEEIPVAAQIIGIVDVYDALTTTRSYTTQHYRPAMSHADALACMRETPSWWRPDVLQAFLQSVSGTAAA